MNPLPIPDWVPRAGVRIRWDRSLAIGDVVFRWHSRLDGTALLYGPAGKLAKGDTVTRLVGHLHKPGPAPTPLYVVTRTFEAEDGDAWLEAERKDETNGR